MRFSIIVPIYNTEKYLDKCIKSVLNQTMSDYELILIDDCSTDDSLTIACKYKSEHIKVLKNVSNSGLSETRNLGIKNASGDYIVFLDSDDYIEKTALLSLNKLPMIVSAAVKLYFAAFVTTRNGLFQSLIFVSIGMLVAETEKLGKLRISTGSIIAAALMYLTKIATSFIGGGNTSRRYWISRHFSSCLQL